MNQLGSIWDEIVKVLVDGIDGKNGVLADI